MEKYIKGDGMKLTDYFDKNVETSYIYKYILDTTNSADLLADELNSIYFNLDPLSNYLKSSHKDFINKKCVNEIASCELAIKKLLYIIEKIKTERSDRL